MRSSGGPWEDDGGGNGPVGGASLYGSPVTAEMTGARDPAPGPLSPEALTSAHAAKLWRTVLRPHGRGDNAEGALGC